MVPASSPLNPYMDIIHPHIDTFNIAKIILFLVVVSGVLKMIFARIRREFWLYYARGCFVQMQDAKNEMDEIRYFVKGLNSYNLYVRRQTNLEIKQLNQIFSKIASFEDLKKNYIIGRFALFFSSDTMVKNNSLDPLREISKLLDTPESELLVGQSLKNRLMEWGAAARDLYLANQRRVGNSCEWNILIKLLLWLLFGNQLYKVWGSHIH